MALVREKPLVWVWESDTWIARTDRGAYCVWDGPSGVRCGYPGSEAIPATDTADGKRICEQAWLETWLRDTYVPPLVWVEVSNDTDGRISTKTIGGWFYIYPDGRYYTSPDGVKGDGRTVDGAKEILNHHNRRLVIGEGE